MKSRWLRTIAFVILSLPLLQAPAFAGEIHEAIAEGDSGRVAESLAADQSLVAERDDNIIPGGRGAVGRSRAARSFPTEKRRSRRERPRFSISSVAR